MGDQVKESNSRPEQSQVDEVLKFLKQHLGDRFQTGAEVCRQHAHTLTLLANQPPDGVAFAQSQDEVAEIVRIAAAHHVPVIAFGGGTSLEGHVNAPLGGISIDLNGMNRIRAVHEADMQAVVEPGVTRDQLNTYLRDRGLFFSVDPGADTATLGGMAATRASGTTTVRYGTIRDNVVNLTVVTADGGIIRTGQRSAKSSAGYDLTHLFIGSEGTLGIITELTVKLQPRPEKIASAVAVFQDLSGACDATIAARQLGLNLARIELLDGLQIKAVNSHASLSLEELPTLFLEFHGSNAGVNDSIEKFRSVAQDFGVVNYVWAESTEKRNELWRARHEALWAVKSYWPGRTTLVTDVCVPLSRLAECVVETQQDLIRSDLIGPIVGHVGDGNFHVIIAHNSGDQDEALRLQAWLDRLAARAIDMDGTCTGEHGIGQGKKSYLQDELSSAVLMMRAVKNALDPKGVLNPGKIF